ncbi:Dehydrogenase/reductase SDR family member 12 [Galdieria sulphuraria]|nr:Dehydrogenase/reductase SDR family member 12 [Galdieria sulphuraria]
MQLIRQTEFIVLGLLHFTKSAFSSRQKLFEPLSLNHESLHCVITGANSGIGYATAEALAKASCNLYLVCRNRQRGEAAITKLKQTSGNQHIYLYQCDMSSMKQVKQLAEQLIFDQRPVNVLIHNAGCMAHRFQLTEEGFETNFVTNVLSVFYLTELLLPTLNKNGPSRVIVVSSGGMLTERLETDDLPMKKEPFDVEYWSTKYVKMNTSFFSMHPGWVNTPVVQESMPQFYKTMKSHLRTPEQGADTVVWLACSSSVRKEDSGNFFLDRSKVEKHLPLARTHYSKQDMERLYCVLQDLVTSFENTQNDEK